MFGREEWGRKREEKKKKRRKGEKGNKILYFVKMGLG